MSNSLNKDLLDYITTNHINQSEIAAKLGIKRQNLNRILNADDMKVSMALNLIQETGAHHLLEKYFPKDYKINAAEPDVVGEELTEYNNKRLTDVENNLQTINKLILMLKNQVMNLEMEMKAVKRKIKA